MADTLPMQMDLLKAGYSNGQVGQRPFDMGYKSMFVLQDIVNKKKVHDPIYTGLDVCTPENRGDLHRQVDSAASLHPKGCRALRPAAFLFLTGSDARRRLARPISGEVARVGAARTSVPS